MGWFRNLGSERPWAQGLVICAAGVVLAGTSCFGFLATLQLEGGSNASNMFPVVTAIVFGLSVLAVLVGGIWFVVGLVRNATRNRTPPAPPSGAGRADA